MNPFKLLSIALILTAVFSGCEKDISPVETSANGARIASTACTTFRYPDSVFYYREQPTDYIVSPVTAQSGKYGAYPAGMIINATTGAINVSKSESGLRYRVWFVPTGRTDTCSRYVTISGINYANAIYVLNNNDTLALPFYNALRGTPPPCDDDDDDDDEEEDDDDDDDDDGCEFDDGRDDDDGDGLGDEPPAGKEIRPLGVDVSKADAIINLKRTVANGFFGATPVNGRTRTVRMYYRIDDASAKALNYIDIKFSYYTRRSDIPASVLKEISDKNGSTYRLSAAATLSTFKVRPPHIVVTQRTF